MTDRNINFHLKQAWEEKYRANNCQKYQWIDSNTITFQKIKVYFPQQKQISILELGSGTSALSQTLYKAGYQNITCVDFSKRVIKSRMEKNKNIKFINADFTQPFKFAADMQYDLIIDKGSIDCVFCEDDYLRKILVCVRQCYRRLKDGGKLISLSLGLPKNRKFWYRNKLAPFRVEIKKMKNEFREKTRTNAPNYNKEKSQNSEDYYLYVCTKRQGSICQYDQGNMEGVQFDGEDNKSEASKQTDKRSQQQGGEEENESQKQENSDSQKQQPGKSQDFSEGQTKKEKKNNQQANSQKENNCSQSDAASHKDKDQEDQKDEQYEADNFDQES